MKILAAGLRGDSSNKWKRAMGMSFENLMVSSPEPPVSGKNDPGHGGTKFGVGVG
jgi:hypothetical protein